MDIMTAIAAVTQTIDGIRKLREIEKDFDAASFKLQIADLASSLSDAKLALTDVQQEIASKDREIERLIGAVKFHGRTVNFGGYDYETTVAGDRIGMPFCPVCLINDAVHIRLAHDEHGVRGEAFCPRCKSKHTRVLEAPIIIRT